MSFNAFATSNATAMPMALDRAVNTETFMRVQPPPAYTSILSAANECCVVFALPD